MVLGNKKAAIEMSLATIITIVLSVVFLILALIVLRNMYGFQSQSVGAVQDKTLAEINKLYLSGEETTGVTFSLGSDKIASVRSGTDSFGIEIATGTADGAKIKSEDQVQIKLSLDENSPVNCLKKLGGKTQVVKFFKVNLDTWLNLTRFRDAAGATIVYVGIPAGTPVCEQLVKVQVRDNTYGYPGDTFVQDTFTLKILRKVPFS